MWGLISIRVIVLGSSSAYAITPLEKKLQSKSWQVRRDAFEEIAASPAILVDPYLRTILVRLRDLEDLESETGKEDLFEDDDYLAYDDELTRLVEKLAVATNDSKAWRSLVYMRYNPDSQTAHWLADHGQALPYILAQTKRRQAVRRMTSVYVLAIVLAKSRHDRPLNPSLYRAYKRIIVSKAKAEFVMVQQSAIQGLGLIGDEKDIPLLERLSSSAGNEYTRKFAAEAASQVRQANGR